MLRLYAQSGDTITWVSRTPKTEGAWSDPTQWDLGRVPEDGDIVVLPSPTGGTASYNFMTTTAEGLLPATGRFKRVEINAARRLSGTMGSVTAKGGTGDGHGGSGGGGRVAIYYGSLAADLDLSVAATGGSFKTETERSDMWGEDGTVFWKQVSKGLVLIFK